MRLLVSQLIRNLPIEAIKIYRSYATMDPQLETYFKTALELTKQAGKLVKEKISEEKRVETKAYDIDLVTETDKAVEKMLFEGLAKAFPDHKFIGEETASAGEKIELTAGPTWVIDPVDGTMNFVHSFPHSCISVSLFVDCDPVIGIIHNPSLDQLFTAVKGNGAFYNGKRMEVSKETKLARALVVLEVGTSRDEEKVKAVFHDFCSIVPKVHGTRSLGAAALNMSMVALGAAETYFEYGTHIWDIGAGEIIIREAGGIVIDPKGSELDRMSRRMLCANNREIADQLIPLLAQYYPPRD